MKRWAYVVGVSLLMAMVSIAFSFDIAQAVNWNSGGG